MNLTDDEYSVLLIAAEGQSMMPIGRWEQPVESLVARGLLTRRDKFNNVISVVGREALQQREADNDRGLVRVVEASAAMARAQKDVQDFAEQAARLLAQAARVSALVTGDAPEDAARQWSHVILSRALQVLHENPGPSSPIRDKLRQLGAKT